MSLLNEENMKLLEEITSKFSETLNERIIENEIKRNENEQIMFERMNEMYTLFQQIALKQDNSKNNVDANKTDRDNEIMNGGNVDANKTDLDDDVMSERNGCADKNDRDDINSDTRDVTHSDSHSEHSNMNDERNDRAVAIRTKHTKIDVIRPQSFSGGSSGMNRLQQWKVFKEQLYTYFGIMEINGSVLTEFMMVSLTIQLLTAPAVDHALRIKQTLVAKNSLTLEALIKGMDKLYDSSTLKQSKYSQLFQFKQIDGEKVTDYHDRFLILLHEVRVEEEVVIHKVAAALHFANGLFPCLKAECEKAKTRDRVLDKYAPDEADEAVMRLCHVASAEEQLLLSNGKGWLLKHPVHQQRSQPRGGNQQAYRSSAGPTSTTQTSPQPQARSAPSNPAPPSTGPNNRTGYVFRCFNCNGAGHKARFCTKPRTTLNMFEALSDGTNEDEKEQQKN